MGLRSDSVAGVRFLAAVCEGRGIKPAARSMGVHSWTGYRWLREALLAHRCNGLRAEAAQSQVGFFTAKALPWEEEFLAGLGDGRHHLPVRVSRRPSGRARPGQGNRALSAALELCRPRNWWGTGASQSLLRAARSEGLPLSWVPRSEIIVELDGCADDKARLHVLESRRGLILQDCEDTLGECTDEWVIDDVTLARRALEAIRAGHDEAGMALAVALGEPRAAWAATPRARAFWSEEDRADWEKKRSKSK